MGLEARPGLLIEHLLVLSVWRLPQTGWGLGVVERPCGLVCLVCSRTIPVYACCFRVIINSSTLPTLDTVDGPGGPSLGAG